MNQTTSGLSRREMLKLSAAGVSAFSLSGWMNVLATRAANEGSTKHKSCILLWMDGGPSHKDTFDMKPGTKDAGEYSPIKTSVPGIEISEHFPKFAQQMQHAAILRGMTTGEGAHGRAKYYMHTGYKEGVGGIVHPSIGSIVSAELGSPEFALPNFVTVGARGYGAGFLGPSHNPLMVRDPQRGVENLRPFVAEAQFDRRVGLLQEMESAFHRDYKSSAGVGHSTTVKRAVNMMKSKEAKAFDLSSESSATKSAYGTSRFGQGCLLARRLVETGVKFVEVGLGGWDTHNSNFDRVKSLSSQVDPAISTLITDLKERGLLDDTLIIWMGEFGRTPKINSRGPKVGRDHYPKAWSSVLVGGGIKGGQVIGKTDTEGATVVERPIGTLDFMASVCQILGINYKKNNTTANGRPLRIVEKGENLLSELF